ncbi:MAG: hypothetical protein B9S32_12240 [Verrucomicrobia bacterium Tous-C9LFEB]|nr:MAG: hypothetical protein B9S32_12240 [Verrucomicrobia bacterium Tous-C9LFEB]
MLSVVELRRLMAEWRIRWQRVRDVVAPPVWAESDWRRFSQGVALLVIDHGQSWIIDPNTYWDMRWKLQGGGELIAQVEYIPQQKTTLIVAQQGGFTTGVVDSYTWLWAEFDMEGNFLRDPYWVDGTWKEALTMLLLPFQKQAGFYLEAPTQTPKELLLQEGARPNENATPRLDWKQG